MKVIALLSGGKDSIYNLHHAILNGHEPVCVASLGPPPGQDELDSFMYQTVAHSGLATLSEALGLPFFSRPITGKPLNQSSEYGSRSTNRSGGGQDPQASRDADQGKDQDETEDLYRLLADVQRELPDVEGVACGAILSNYQRVRVEHVCTRLALTPIAYLWQRNQRDLLHEMVVSGQESVLVKVAGAGLGVEHLGRTLGQMEPILHRLNAMYETHICGEGGEYETFTLDSPIFKRRILLDETRTIISNPDPHSTVAHLYLSRLSLADKPDYPSGGVSEEMQSRLKELVKVEDVLGDIGQEVRDDVAAVWEREDAHGIALEGLELDDRQETELEEGRSGDVQTSTNDGWLYVSGISAFGKASSSSTPKTSEFSIEQEVEACFDALIAALASNDASLPQVTHLTLLLSESSMSLFPRLNKVYSTYFGTSPPTRACVAVRFPPGDPARIKMEAVATVRTDDVARGEADRTALHVQSLSYWGAANIGPYSQAVTTKNRCYIAGQIPLIPASLTLPSPPSFPLEVALSLQHVGRIVRAASEQRWRGWMEAGIGWIAETDSRAKWNKSVEAARAGWDSFNSIIDEDGHHKSTPPVLFVSAAQLPRSASVEWQVTWQTAQVPWTPDDDDATSESDTDNGRHPDVGKPTKRRRVETQEDVVLRSGKTGKAITWQCSPVNGLADSVVGILACSRDERERPAQLAKLGQIHSVKAFHRPGVPISRVRSIAEAFFPSSSGDPPVISFIGSKFIETKAGAGLHDVAFVVVAQVVQFPDVLIRGFSERFGGGGDSKLLLDQPPDRQPPDFLRFVELLRRCVNRLCMDLLQQGASGSIYDLPWVCFPENVSIKGRTTASSPYAYDEWCSIKPKNKVSATCGEQRVVAGPRVMEHMSSANHFNYSAGTERFIANERSWKYNEGSSNGRLHTVVIQQISPDLNLRLHNLPSSVLWRAWHNMSEPGEPFQSINYEISFELRPAPPPTTPLHYMPAQRPHGEIARVWS
ncbi:hypothetical protein JCM10212_000020 [Sporobolomyces blumeae]